MEKNKIKCSGKTIYNDDDITLINCKKCKFVHTFPYPKKEILDKMYKESFYEEEKPQYIKKFEDEKDYWLSIYNERYEIVESLIKSKKRRVLDIGSSIGYFLESGIRKGWEVLGIEPSKTAADFANKNNIKTINNVIEDIEINDLGKFSFIHMSLVLEHICNPDNLIELSYKLLEKGGIISIEVPNEFNPLQKIFVENLNKSKYWITSGKTPHHLNYFSKSGLKSLLLRNKFKVVYDTVSFPMEFFVLMGDDYIGNDPVGKLAHQRRMEFEKNLLRNNPILKMKLYKKLSELNIGREVIIFGKK